MFRRLQSLTPPFLLRLDRALLTHMPTVWASRIHMVAFWGLAVLALALGRALITPMHTYDVPDFELNFWLLMLPITGIWMFWGWQGHLFSVEKQFGQIRPAQEWLTQGLLFAGTALLAATPFLYTNVLIHRADSLVTPSQLNRDIIDLNQGQRFFCQAPDEVLQWRNDEVTSLPFGMSVWGESVWGEPEGKGVLTAPHSQQEALARIEAYKTAFYRYSGHKIGTNTEALYTAYQSGEAIVDPYDGGERYVVEDSLRDHVSLKNRSVFLQDTDAALGWAFLVGIASLVLMVFVKTNLKTFMLASLATFVAVGSTLSVAVFALDAANIGGNTDEVVIFALLMGLYAFFLQQTYRSRLSQKWEWWPVSSLVAVSLATPLMPIAGLYFVTEILGIRGTGGAVPLMTGSTPVILMGLLCFLTGYLGWNFVFRRRLAVLHALPRTH